MRTKTIKQTGFVIGGDAIVVLWDGTRNLTKMMKTYLPYHKATPKNILRCVNDSGFGCQSIQRAYVDIYVKYDNGSEEYDRTIYADHPIHTQHFLGWGELRKQGIKV